MKLSPHHLKLYKQIALLFLRYGQSGLVQDAELADTLSPEELAAQRGQGESPEALAGELERMGPTFVKLGQILSSRADLMPDHYLKALSRLQDQVKPFDYQEVEEIVTAELGVRISKAFSHFNPKPLAAASLGQVHEAALRDGRPVVVKVQRPRIRQQIATDMEVLEELATFFENHTKVGRMHRFTRVFGEFRKTLISELDYQKEASNLIAIRDNLAEFPNIHIPTPVLDYSTRSVLTMEYVSGRKITSLSPLARLDLNGGALADEFFRAYLKQVLIDGLFHADPHPGNVFLTENKQVALLDMGMVGRLSPTMQENCLKLLLAISEGRGDETAELAIRISETSSHFKEADFRHRITELVGEQAESRLTQLDVGKTLLFTARISGETGLYVPRELTLLGKTLMQLEEVGRALDPEFKPTEAVKKNVMELMNRRMKSSVSSGKMLNSFLELKEFATALPSRLNKILDAVANAELEVKVRPMETQPLLDSIQKIANRITTGLILAALIVGASLLMQVKTPFMLFGYPGLAILFFLAAAGGGLWLVLNIVVQDHRDRRKRR